MRTKPIETEDGEGNRYFLTECECHDGHMENETVCQWCWGNERRHPLDPSLDAVTEDSPEYIAAMRKKFGDAAVNRYLDGLPRDG